MVRSELTIAIVLSLLASAHSVAAAQQDRIGADATTTAVGVHTHIGRRVSYVCPAIPPAQMGSAEVWGSDVYASDSPICLAAIHAGVLQAGRPGVVTILLASGADAFTGSARNGVTTKDYGPNATSYSFDRSGSPGQIDWGTNGLGIPETFTASIPVTCPSGGAMTFPLWGSDIYHQDSSICTAALHAGLITRANGGTFFVTRDVEQNTFPSTDRNGVKSTAWSAGSGAFRVAASSTALIATATNAPAPVAGTTTPPAVISQPRATPTVMTTICSPGQTKPGYGPTSVTPNTNFLSPTGGDLNWPAARGAAGYVVERAPASGGTPTKIATTCDNEASFANGKDNNNLDAVFFKDRTGSIQPMTTYVYVVRAFGSGGEMGWNSARWTSPVVPIPRINAIGAYNGTVVIGSTVRLHWEVRSTDGSTNKITIEPTDFLVTTEYGFSQVISRGRFTGCGCNLDILSVPLGTHTFTVEARWPPDVKRSSSMAITIAP